VENDYTIPSQITSLIIRHGFDDHAEVRYSGLKLRSYNRWSQCMAMLTMQHFVGNILLDITYNLKALQSQLYTLGMKPTSIATLVRVNEKQPAFPWAIFRKKRVIKLDMGIDADGYLTTFMNINDAKVHEINWAKSKPKLPNYSFVIFDIRLTDYDLYSSSRKDRNAVLTQVSIFLCAYLPNTYLNFKAKLDP
jgi:Domain of unknown function (DUF4372)